MGPPGMFSCYKFVLVPYYHADAREYCKEEGADLVAIESPDEHMFVTNYIKNRPELRTRSYWTSVLISMRKLTGRGSPPSRPSRVTPNGAPANRTELGLKTAWNFAPLSGSIGTI